MIVENFAITGVAGFVAPRHLQAIKETGNALVAALDPHDSVGVLDKYFPNANFFTETERFDRFLERLRFDDDPKSVSYVSICSPNYLHDAHCRLALRVGANAICEKPLVINPRNLDVLRRLESENNKKIYTVLQMRYHPELQKLKQMIDDGPSNRIYSVILTYITPRGNWYKVSWKGDNEKSGGLAINIGIHLFDLLIWLFGHVVNCCLYYSDSDRISGMFLLEKAQVNWFLSICPHDIERNLILDHKVNQPYREMIVDGLKITFSEVSQDLHTEVYKRILRGDGFGIDDALPSIELAHKIRNLDIVKKSSDCHPLINYFT